MTSEPASHTPVQGLKIALCIGALGVVFGDIGTSPLYTLRECLRYVPVEGRVEGVLGVLSLMFWSLMFQVGFKYLSFVTKADNRGEGGIFALLALSHTPGAGRDTRRIALPTLLILAGAALLYGDGIITPAISVLGAAEGLATFSSGFDRFVVPISVVILAVLFYVQRQGTRTIGGIFGPVILLWFLVLGGFGIYHIFDTFEVFRALNPLHGLRLLHERPEQSAALLGAVVLTFTGAEALYADMGHFGRAAIARSWYFVVCPGLLLNYFGQGAYVIAHPDDPTNPFFALAPDGPLRIALVIISIFAAIIASQALISGTYSLTRQAIQLGYFPRLKILHTNAEQQGQIYVPMINALLAFGSIAVVIGFGSSANLAAAYGIAVTGTMVVTTFAFFLVIHRRWRWPLWKSLPLCAAFLVFDLTFFGANLHKLPDGGWFPIAIGLLVLAIMHTWKTGRNEIQEKTYGGAINDLKLSNIAKSTHIVRVPGTAFFMVATSKGTPLALLHHLKANKCLQQIVILLTIATEEFPHVEESRRLTVEEMGEGVWRAVGRYGYMESPDVTDLVARIKATGVPLNPDAATFYFNREMIITGGNARMFEWQKGLYAFLSRNARPVKDYYQILPTQIIEIGLPVQL